MKIGFIGLGLMGSRMAKNLIENGYELVVYNRSKEKISSLSAKGAAAANSPAEVGRTADVVFTMLSDPAAVYNAAFGENGFAAEMKPGAIWIDCSTVNPSFTIETANKAAKMNIRFIDAPVAGTILPAEKGELIFFAGGNQKDVDECMPYFNAMGKKTIFLGKNGRGTGMKMIINLILAQAMAAFSEGMALGEALGFKKEELLNALIGGPVTAPFIAGKKMKIENADFEPEFPLKWMHKDLQLAAITGYENNVSLPLTNAAKEIYSLALQYGLGGQDFSAIYQFLNKRNE